MSLMFRAQRSASDLIPGRVGWRRGPTTKKAALAHSAVWACTALRGNLISTLPIDVYRKVGRDQVEVPKPPVLNTPSRADVDITEWLYSSQTDLDAVGNAFGTIVERDGAGIPRRVDLVAREEVSVQSHNGEITYWYSGKKQDPDTVWHERQYTSSGMVVGLSPLANAALDLQQHAAAQQFAAAWFGGGLMPLGHLKHNEQRVPAREAEAIKLRYRLAIENGDPLVTGKDWEYNPVDAAKAQANFIEAMRFSDVQICRYFGVPGDLIDANVSGASITYANITQRNLQFLILHLGPTIKRREVKLSQLVIAPRFVKLNSEALLRMDPETVSKMLGQQVRDRLRAPSEAREKLNLAAYTDDQLQEFRTLFPNIYSQGAGEPTAADEARRVAELVQKIYLGVGKVVTADEAREIANRAGAGLTGTFDPTGGTQ